ncbi:MAG: DoxX family protein [Cyclobacteriaceae bacterium]
MPKNIAYTIARFLAAVIMLQTLYFKFTGSPESIYIFEKCGMEPTGRWTVGICELIAAVLLMVPRTAWLGGVMGLGLMSGAIVLHLTRLGIEVMDDGGYLFLLAMIVFVCSIYVIFANRNKIFKQIIPKILGKK